MTDITEPTVVVSSCIIGTPVRYDGTDKKQEWLVNVLSKHVSWVPVCPELEMGLGVPREPIQLVQYDSDTGTRLISVHTKRDLTELAQDTALLWLASCNAPAGFILKARSPSCGYKTTPLISTDGQPGGTTSGIFARHCAALFPGLPIINEEDLQDMDKRSAFLTQLFTCFRLQSLLTDTQNDFQTFQRKHKYLTMLYSSHHCKILGNLAANKESLPFPELFRRFRELLGEAFAVPVTMQKRRNVLEHIAGYFRKASSDERKRVQDAVSAWQSGASSWQETLATVHAAAKEAGITYLEEQFIFCPYPRELDSNVT